jgi:hypothetical protein
VTTSAPSTAPIVVATLVQQLQSAPALANVQMLYGDTAQAERENLMITGNIQWEEEVWATLSARGREEHYVVDGYCQVRTPGHSQQEALERTFELVGVVESTLRSMAANPGMGFSPALNAAFGLGKAQVFNLEFRPTKGMGFPAPEGRAYQLDFGLRVSARI